MPISPSQLLRNYYNTRCFSRDKISGEWETIKSNCPAQDLTNGYDTFALVNTQARNVLIVHTNHSDWQGGVDSMLLALRTNIETFFGYTPKAFSNTSKFLDELIKSSKMQLYQDYNIINVGHYATSVISDLAAVHLIDKGFDAQSISFCSPGTKPIVKNYMLEKNIDIDDFDQHFSVYNLDSQYRPIMHEQITQPEMIPVSSAKTILGNLAQCTDGASQSIKYADTLYSMLKELNLVQGKCKYAELLNSISTLTDNPIVSWNPIEMVLQVGKNLLHKADSIYQYIDPKYLALAMDGYEQPLNSAVELQETDSHVESFCMNAHAM